MFYVDPLTGSRIPNTVYPVPCLIMDEVHWRLSTGGGLSHITPTLLQLMGLDKPARHDQRQSVAGNGLIHMRKYLPFWR
ncbi:MAG: hypothetical protein R3E95_07510 [Thiolinea sp.]